MADQDTEVRDVDGIVVPPPTEIRADVRGTPREPPSNTAKGGGSSSGAQRPEDTIPEQTVAAYKARGSESTGVDYAGEQRKFLNYLKAQGLHFGNMPPGTAQRFAVETVPNAVTRNKTISALTAMFNAAEAMGIRFEKQEMERAKRKPKEKPMQQPQSGIPAGATLPNGQPASMYLPGQPLAGQQPGASMMPMQTMDAPTPPPAPAAPVAPKPVTPAVRPPEAFPSLGKRVRVSKLADGSQFGIPPGTEIGIGTYQKEQIEAYGSIDGFLGSIIRPVHGPFPGQPPVIYRVQQLDTAAKPLPGQFWDVPIAADPMGQPAPHAQPQPHPFVPNGLMMPPQQQGYPAPAPAGGRPVSDPTAIMERLMDRALEQAKEERLRYEQQRKDLEEKRGKGEIGPTEMFVMLQNLEKPKPIDAAELRRQLREEMDRAAPQQIAPAPLPPGGLGGLFDGPRSDPTVDKLTEMVSQLNRQIVEMASKPQTPQKDPIEMMTALATAMKAMQPPPPPPPPENPLMVQLAAIALKQVTEPAKPKTLSDLFLELGELQKMKHLLGGGEPPPPSLGEQLMDVMHAAIENADKLGDMFARLKGGAAKSAFKQAAQSRQLAAQAQPPAQPVQQQPPRVTEATAELFLAMVKALDANIPPDDLFVAVVAVLEQLRKDPDPYPKVAEMMHKKFNEANSRLDLQTLVVRFFQWVGAHKLVTETRVERLTALLHEHYSTIYRLLNEGAEKVIADAPPPAEEAPPEDASPVPTEEQPEDESDDAAEGDVDEEEEEGEEDGEVVEDAASPEKAAANS